MGAIIQALLFEDYLARPALSVSRLKAFAKAPALAHVAKEETAAMRLGSLVHCAILEPTQLERRYSWTALDRRGTKAWIAEEVAIEGRELVKRDEWDDARRIADAAWANPTARNILDGCQTEVSAFWRDQETSLDCKARADIFSPARAILADIKTTCDASPRAFERDFAKFKYGWQDVHYRDGFAACGVGIEAFFFIAIEKDPPHLVKVHYLNPAQLDAIRAVVRRHMADYADCLALNDWPGYGNTPNQINLPAWELE